MVCWTKSPGRYALSDTRKPTAADLFASPACFLGLGFGSGLAPVAPGTFGTLAAIPLYILLQSQGDTVFLLFTLVAAVTGIWICGETAKRLQTHDHGAIVWDEIVGFLLTMAVVDFTIPNLICGFILFRIFDIVKPWPIGWADKKVQGGLGIMLDDIIAGIFAAIVLLVINLSGVFGLCARIP